VCYDNIASRVFVAINLVRQYRERDNMTCPNWEAASRYEVIIYWSAEDEAFIAEVPELPGCMADGATYQEALTNAEIIIQEWMETARELKRPIPEPKGRLVYA